MLYYSAPNEGENRVSDYAPIFTITPEILSLSYDIASDLERIDIFRERVLTPQLRKENRILTIHSSLWIEANSLTLEQVTDIVNGKRVKGPKKDIQEVKNSMAAYDELLECNPYGEKDLLKQHGLLMKGLIESAGKYRSAGVGVFSGNVPVHVAPPHKRVPVLMSQLLDWTQRAKLPQVVKSCIFHYEFEFIHPFSDGNGRMGRMWQTLLLYQQNPVFAWLPVENIIAHNQQDYYRAIRRSTRHNDSGIFTQFMLAAIKQATAEFKEKHKRGELQNGGAIGGVSGGVKFSKTQEKIITLMAEDSTISQLAIMKKLKIGKTTVYQNIEKLKQLGVLERKGSDKAGHWEVSLAEARRRGVF